MRFKNEVMTDKQFQKLIDRCVKAAKLHYALLQDAEAEYERRFGFNPSDVDDDFWIDSLHHGDEATVAQVTESADGRG